MAGTFDYYSALAQRVAPTTLARVAARRALRAARNVVGRPARFTTEQIQHAFGVSAIGQLAARAFDDRAGFTWCEAPQRARTLAALRQVEGAVERALVRAERAARQRFTVFGTEVSFEERGLVDWFLDPVSGYRYSLVPVAELKLAKGSDPKYPWAIGRLDQLVALGQGYWASNDSGVRARFAHAFVKQLGDFIRANPVGVGIQWLCPMEVALRGANIAQALLMFSDAPEARDGAFLARAFASLAEHAAHVEDNLENEGAVPNNHLLSNYVGLLVIGLLHPRLPNAARQVELATVGLKEEMENQVHPDGCSFEGSIPYHRLAVELFTLAQVVATANGVDLGVTFARRLERMFDVTRAYCSKDGLAPQLGDNDSGRVFPLRDRPSLDHGYLGSLGAALFSASELKGADDTFSDEAAWLLGERGLKRFERLEARAVEASFSSVASGWNILRGAGAVVTVSAGANGQKGVGGHSHLDKLSFELHVDGTPLIVDPGSPTYTREPNVRNAYRRTAAHNVLMIDDREQAAFDPARLFALMADPKAGIDVFQTGVGLDRIVARHCGYAPLGVERMFILDKRNRALCVSDLATGSGVHSLAVRIHLPDTLAHVRTAGGDVVDRAAQIPESPSRLGACVDLGPNDAPRAHVVFEEGVEVTLEPSQYSPGYGETRPAATIVARKKADLATKDGGRIGWVVLF